MRLAIVTGTALLLLAGCTSPGYEQPQIPVPDGWELPGSQGPSMADRSWITVFPIPELNSLVDEALANNSDLLVAAQRVMIVGAQYGIERSSLYPSLDASATLTRQRAPGLNPAANTVSESTSVGLLSAAWEIDIWGKLRDQTEAARRQFMADAAFYQAAQVSLAAQVATLYLDLLDLDNQIRISTRTVEFRRRGLRINQSRFEEGIASILDVRQAQSLLASGEQVLYDQQRRRALAENALSTLLGRNPGAIRLAMTLDELQLPAGLTAGIPSELIERRADIYGAEQALRGAYANVSAARKEYFPSLSLTSALGFASPGLATLFQGGRYAWSLQPGISTNIFSAGRIGFGIDIAQSQQEILVQKYKATIRAAFKEVNDALVNLEQRSLEKEAGQRVVTANQARVKGSTARYLSGISPFFEVLDAERQLLESQIVLSQIKRSQYDASIELYRVLGGGWTRGDFHAPTVARVF